MPNQEHFQLRDGTVSESSAAETPATQLAKSYYEMYSASHRFILAKGVDRDFLTFEYPTTEDIPNSSTEYRIIFTAAGVFQVKENIENGARKDLDLIPKFQQGDVDQLVDICARAKALSYVRGKFIPQTHKETFFPNANETRGLVAYDIKMLDLKNNPEDRALVLKARLANEIKKEELYDDVDLNSI